MNGIVKTETYIDYRQLTAEINRRFGTKYRIDYVRNAHKGIQLSGVILKYIDEILNGVKPEIKDSRFVPTPSNSIHESKGGACVETTNVDNGK